MRMMVLVAVFGVILLFSGGAAAQETSHFLTPAGFYLPLLQQGEYLVTAEWNFWRQDGLEKYDATPGIDDEYMYREMSLAWNSAYALTNRFLVGASLAYSPPQDRGRQRYWNRYDLGDLSTYTYDQRLTQQLVPQVILAFRPKDNLELHCRYDYRSEKYDYTFVPPPSYAQRESGSMTGHSVTVGLTYHGKL